MQMIELKTFKIYGLVLGINLFSSELEDDFSENETPYKMIQIMLLVFGFSIIIWDAE